MAKFNKDYYKQKVGYYRQLLTLFFAVEVGCVAWFAANYNNANIVLLIVDFLSILVFCVLLGIFNSKIRDYIKRLRD